MFSSGVWCMYFTRGGQLLLTDFDPSSGKMFSEVLNTDGFSVGLHSALKILLRRKQRQLMTEIVKSLKTERQEAPK